ncbi:ABC transporter ATP-binding protein [Albimonas sp. CAU 1670]|uniref:ABC transporter ATP-binding protein n=1 Tax=Albimonas sp. CAU 1670 TaxID=3032599 RepID=UPI0023DAC8BD|nr:ABC transporter ATP-binding protein [Albimonas sp. CAU 1670]MDF2235055.1 ABC transporter ATP-binding protein [Albimonas sp. CAU 1670]
MPLLEIEDLAIDLARDGERLRLVHGASLSVAEGETVAVVGESGSGKSLTALAAMGLLPEELTIGAGRIRFDGRDLAALDEEARRALRGGDMAMIFQEPMTALNPVLSIGRQLTEGMRAKLGISKSEAAARAVELLAQVGVTDPERRLAQYPHQFSGGMRQRVVIAMALACRPRLILADEPTTALDVTIQAQILALTAKLCREHGVGLVLITHNLGIVARYADRVTVMYAGGVVEAAEARALYKAPRHPYTRGLLDSVPRLDLDRASGLQPIPGSPPDPMRPVAGCRFHPRCARAEARCRAEEPPLERAGDHAFACWRPLPLPTPEPAA